MCEILNTQFFSKIQFIYSGNANKSSLSLRNKIRGNVLIVTLIFLGALSVTVGTALHMTNVQGQLTSRTGDGYKLFAASDAELERMYSLWKSLMNQQQLSKFQYPGAGDLYMNVINTCFADTSGNGSGMATLLGGSGGQLNGVSGVNICYNPTLTGTYNNTDNGNNQCGVKTLGQRIRSVNSLGEPKNTTSGTTGNFSPTLPTYSAAYPGHPGWFVLNTTYLAEVSLYMIGITGSFSVHVGRTFTQSVIPVSQAAIYYYDDLVFHPGSSMTIAGPVHSNGSLDIRTSSASATLALTGNVSYSSPVLLSSTSITGNGGTVVSSTSTGSTARVAPDQWTSPLIPVPYDTYIDLNSSTNLTSTNTTLKQNVSEGYRELLDPPMNAFTSGSFVPGYSPQDDINNNNDPSSVSRVRFFNQAGLKLVASKSGTSQIVKAYDINNNEIHDTSGFLAMAINSSTTAVTSGTLNNTIYDYRQQTNIEVTNIDLYWLNQFINSLTVSNGIYYFDTGNSYNGIVYFTNTDQAGANAGQSSVGGTTTAVRLLNGAQLPTTGTNGNGLGFTFATNDGLYIQGNYNTQGGTVSASGTTPLPAQVLADAVTVLSNGWSDANNTTVNSGSSGLDAISLLGTRIAQNTTIQTSIVSGIAVDSNGADPGGAHNFIRLLEAWSPDPANPKTLNFMGSIAQLFHSQVFNGLWRGTSDANRYYSTPYRNWSFNPDVWNHPPPGTFANILFVRGQWTRY